MSVNKTAFKKKEEKTPKLASKLKNRPNEIKKYTIKNIPFKFIRPKFYFFEQKII